MDKMFWEEGGKEGKSGGREGGRGEGRAMCILLDRRIIGNGYGAWRERV